MTQTPDEPCVLRLNTTGAAHIFRVGSLMFIRTFISSFIHTNAFALGTDLNDTLYIKQVSLGVNLILYFTVLIHFVCSFPIDLYSDRILKNSPWYPLNSFPRRILSYQLLIFWLSSSISIFLEKFHLQFTIFFLFDFDYDFTYFLVSLIGFVIIEHLVVVFPRNCNDSSWRFGTDSNYRMLTE